MAGGIRAAVADKAGTVTACLSGRNSGLGRFLGKEEGMIYIKWGRERAARPLLEGE